jgi:hypothetical protein
MGALVVFCISPHTASVAQGCRGPHATDACGEQGAKDGRCPAPRLAHGPSVPPPCMYSHPVLPVWPRGLAGCDCAPPPGLRGRWCGRVRGCGGRHRGAAVHAQAGPAAAVCVWHVGHIDPAGAVSAVVAFVVRPLRPARGRRKRRRPQCACASSGSGCAGRARGRGRDGGARGRVRRRGVGAR